MFHEILEDSWSYQEMVQKGLDVGLQKGLDQGHHIVFCVKMDKQEASNGRRQIALLKRLQQNRKRQQR